MVYPLCDFSSSADETPRHSFFFFGSFYAVGVGSTSTALFGLQTK